LLKKEENGGVHACETENIAVVHVNSDSYLIISIAPAPLPPPSLAMAHKRENIERRYYPPPPTQPTTIACI
jgi:hypothetical protein